MTDEHRSPLHEWHEAHGADTLVEDGWPWPMHEGTDPMVEYEAVRTGTGIWDLFSTSKYEVTGPDAGRLIQRRFTNSLAGMQDGQVRYGAFVNADGKMIDDGNVYKHADDKYWVMINTPDIQDWFTETADGLDAQVAHRTEDFGMIAVQGPTAQGTLQGLTDRDLGELKYFRFWPEPTKVAGKDAWVLRTGFSGEKGYEVVTAPEDSQAVWDALIAAGGVPFGLTAIDLARTEVGLIIIAVDYNPNEISPWDLSMDKFIKTDTENVGAEALASYGATPAEAVQDPEDRGRRDAGLRRRGHEGRPAGRGRDLAGGQPAPGHDRAGDPRRRCRHRRREGRSRDRGWHRARHGRGAVAARSREGEAARLTHGGTNPEGAGRTGPPLCLCWGDDRR